MRHTQRIVHPFQSPNVPNIGRLVGVATLVKAGQFRKKVVCNGLLTTIQPDEHFSDIPDGPAFHLSTFLQEIGIRALRTEPDSPVISLLKMLYGLARLEKASPDHASCLF